MDQQGLSLDRIWSSCVRQAIMFNQMHEHERAVIKPYLYQKDHERYLACENFDQSLFFFALLAQHLQTHEIYPSWYKRLMHVVKAGYVAQDLLTKHSKDCSQSEAIQQRIASLEANDFDRMFLSHQRKVASDYLKCCQKVVSDAWQIPQNEKSPLSGALVPHGSDWELVEALETKDVKGSLDLSGVEDDWEFVELNESLVEKSCTLGL